MAYFIKRNNGKLLNILLVQNVLLRDTNIVYKMKNGESLEEVYESLEEKAANLLYFVTKNHSFFDGNKK